jgi:hypothetical protein
MVFLYQENKNAEIGKDEKHSDAIGCWFQGLGKEGREKCEEEKRQYRQDKKDAKLSEKEANAELEKAAADMLGEDDGGSDYTPLIIGGVLLVVLVGGFFLIKKTLKK